MKVTFISLFLLALTGTSHAQRLRFRKTAKGITIHYGELGVMPLEPTCKRLIQPARM